MNQKKKTFLQALRDLRRAALAFARASDAAATADDEALRKLAGAELQLEWAAMDYAFVRAAEERQDRRREKTLGVEIERGRARTRKGTP